MINNLIEYLTLDNIYLVANFGVIPLWLLLIFAPNQSITRVLVHSIFAPLILSSAYIFIVYKIFISEIFLKGLICIWVLRDYTQFIQMKPFYLFLVTFSIFKFVCGSLDSKRLLRYSMPRI